MRYLGPLALVLCGCVFIPLEMDLRKPGPTGLTGGDGRRVALEVPFERSGPETSRCGMKKNGYNMDTADVTCSAVPQVWLANRLARSLEATGLEVTTVSPGASVPGGTLQVRGELRQFFVEPVIHFSYIEGEADIEVTLEARTESGLWARRRFYVKQAQSTTIFWTDGSYGEIMGRAIDRVIEEMVAAILTLLNRYPEIGMQLEGWEISARRDA